MGRNAIYGIQILKIKCFLLYLQDVPQKCLINFYFSLSMNIRFNLCDIERLATRVTYFLMILHYNYFYTFN